MIQFLALCPALLCCRKCGTALSGPGWGGHLDQVENLTLKRNLFSPERTQHMYVFWKSKQILSLWELQEEITSAIIQIHTFPFYLNLTFSDTKSMTRSSHSHPTQNQSYPAQRRRKFPQQGNHSSHISNQLLSFFPSRMKNDRWWVNR